MKKVVAALTLLVMTFATVASAEPLGSFNAQAPTAYVNGNAIPVTDTLTYKVYCGLTPGGPYSHSFDALNLDAGTTIDVAACVQGEPGTYYFVATATSSTYGTESAFSNEATRTWTAQELGLVPNAPVLFTIQ